MGQKWDYKDIEKSVVLNYGDTYLRPFSINIEYYVKQLYKKYSIPYTGLPEYEKIDGYGLKPENQVFKYTKIPERLVQLQDFALNEAKKDKQQYNATINRAIDIFWKEMSRSASKYVNEIKFIKREWQRRLWGYWFFCNGQPIYMPGQQYFYLNYYKIRTKEGGDFRRPDYRNRDRLWFIGKGFSAIDTLTFADQDANGRGLLVGGNYRMIDMGRRVCYGTIHPKPRRVGDTSKSGCNETEEALRTVRGHFGIQGIDEKTGSDIYDFYFVMPTKEMPLFFLPHIEYFNSGIFLSTGGIDDLETRIEYAESKHSTAFDGRFLIQYYGDEVGKMDHVDIEERHRTIRLCLSERDVIYGNMTLTSSVENMDGRAAINFKELCLKSQYDERLSNGQTNSGLYVIFFSAADGHPNFIDQWGYSVIDRPSKEQAAFIGSSIGAMEYLLDVRKQKKGDDLMTEKRQNPITFMECFTPSAKNSFIPVANVSRQIQKLNIEKHLKPIKGELYWVTGNVGDVGFKRSDTGMWNFLKEMPPNQANKRYLKNGEYSPMYPDVRLLSGDPFKTNFFEKGSSHSKGAMVDRLLYDPKIDPPDKDIRDWETDIPDMTYKGRIDGFTTQQFAEDVLKTLIYTGAMYFGEHNIKDVHEYIRNMGYGGYIMYDIDKETGRYKNNPGYTLANNANKLDMFNMIRDDILKNSERIRFPELLEELLSIRDSKELTDYDLISAYGGTLLGSKSRTIQVANLQRDMCEHIDYQSLFKEIRYR